MMWLSSAQRLAPRGVAVAALLVIAPGASAPRDTQEPLAPPVTVQQQPANPAKGQAAGAAGDQPDIRQQRRARLLEQREAALRKRRSAACKDPGCSNRERRPSAPRPITKTRGLLAHLPRSPSKSMSRVLSSKILPRQTARSSWPNPTCPAPGPRRMGAADVWQGLC